MNLFIPEGSFNAGIVKDAWQNPDAKSEDDVHPGKSVSIQIGLFQPSADGSSLSDASGSCSMPSTVNIDVISPVTIDAISLDTDEGSINNCERTLENPGP